MQIEHISNGVFFFLPFCALKSSKKLELTAMRNRIFERKKLNCDREINLYLVCIINNQMKDLFEVFFIFPFNSMRTILFCCVPDSWPFFSRPNAIEKVKSYVFASLLAKLNLSIVPCDTQ